jgi:acetyl esterase
MRAPAALAPRMAELLDRIRRAGAPPLYQLLLHEARSAYEERSEVLELPRAALLEVRDLSVAALDGSALTARLYRPAEGRLPVLLYLHGGGFTIGNLETHDSLCRQLALRSGAAVLALDYRLAPEHRFPTAVDDTFAALRWLAGPGADALGLDGGRLGIGGDSAGGTLAAVGAILARDEGLPLRHQLLITPGTAAAPDTESHRLYARGYLLEGEGIEWFFRHYAEPAQRRDWRFAPLLADDLQQVAPACVLLAECDPLVDEGVAYADRLRAAGVPIDFELARGVTHDFIKLGRALPEAHDAQRFVAESIRRALFDGE